MSSTDTKKRITEALKIVSSYYTPSLLCNEQGSTLLIQDASDGRLPLRLTQFVSTATRNAIL